MNNFNFNYFYLKIKFGQKWIVGYTFEDFIESVNNLKNPIHRELISETFPIV